MRYTVHNSRNKVPPRNSNETKCMHILMASCLALVCSVWDIQRTKERKR